MFSMFSRLKETWNKVKNFVQENVRQEKPLFLVTTITLFIVLVMEIIVAIFFTDNEITRVFCYRTWENQAMECSQVYFGLFKLFYVIVKYTSQATIILMIVVFVYLLIGWSRFGKLQTQAEFNWSLWETKKSSSKTVDLREIAKNSFDLKTKLLIEVLIGALSASAIPTGLSLIICGFYNINLIRYMSGVEIYIAFAGISIISIAFLSTMRQDNFITSKHEEMFNVVWKERLKSPEDSHHNGNASERENPS